MDTSIRVKDKTGTVQTLYPKTLIANVEGLQAALDSKGEVSKVKVGSTAYNPSSGVVSLPAYPTTLPASDVSSWAKASSKPTYTASEVGLGNVGNFKAVSTVASQGLSSTEQSNARANIGAGTSSFSGSYNDLSNKPTIPTKTSQLTNDSGYTTNTGTVTGVKVGSTSYSPSSGIVSLPAYPTTLPASDVSSWAKAASKPTYTASEVGAIASSAKGTASGVAELDSNGKVPSSQLPSYVDDVLEYSAKSSFPTTGETGKIYVDTTNNKTYRWSGSAYIEISPSLALGTTSSTAYRGDRGNTAYSHATDSSRLTTATSSGLYKVASTAQGHIASLTAVEKADITALGIPAQDTTYSAATTSTAGLMSASDKTKLNGIATGATAVSESTVSGWGFTKNTGTYSKPSTGIPKTDLASAVQTSLGKADSALQSHQTIKQDGITGATVNRFGTCGTAAGTAAKTVSVTSGTFSLEAGARVSVKFTYANTAGTPTLNVNSTGAKNIYNKGSQITTGSNKSLLAGTVDFIYDGTQWHLIGNYIDTNTTYSSKSAASGGTDVSLVTTGEKYTWNNKGNGTVTSVKVGSTSYSPSSGVVSLPAYPTTLPASDVSAWAKASSKPSYTQDEVTDGSTYKRVSATEKTTWNNKQNALIIGDYSLDLNNLTYVQSASGMYYSTDVYVGNFNRIYSAMAYDFASLKTTDNVNIMISTDRKKIVILSNVNSFNPGAALELQIVGI